MARHGSRLKTVEGHYPEWVRVSLPSLYLRVKLTSILEWVASVALGTLRTDVSF